MHKIFVLQYVYFMPLHEAWNKLIVKQKFCASSWLITEMHSQQNIKKNTYVNNVIQCLTTPTQVICVVSSHGQSVCYINLSQI